MKVKFFRFLSGLFVLVVLAIFAFYTVIKSKNEGVALLQGIWVSFSNVDGLKFGNPVFVKGLPLGDVGTIKITQDKVLVKIILQRDIQFYRDYKIVLKNFSVFGKKAIYINPGKEKFGPVAPNIVLDGISIENPFNAAANLIQENRRNFYQVLANLADITGKVNQSSGSLARFLNDPKVYDESVETLKTAQLLLQKGQEMYYQFRSRAVSESVQSVIYELDD